MANLVLDNCCLSFCLYVQYVFWCGLLLCVISSLVDLTIFICVQL